MLTKEKCLRALTILATKNTNAEDLMKIYPYFKYELDMMINLIEEHFELLEKYQELQDENARLSVDKIVNNIEDMNYKLWLDNPPLKFEELKPKMWVWDNSDKEYKYISSFSPLGNDCWLSCVATEFGEPLFKIGFEENRFYRKQVEE